MISLAVTDMSMMRVDADPTRVSITKIKNPVVQQRYQPVHETVTQQVGTDSVCDMLNAAMSDAHSQMSDIANHAVLRDKLRVLVQTAITAMVDTHASASSVFEKSHVRGSSPATATGETKIQAQIRRSMGVKEIDFDSMMTELAMIQHTTAGLRTESMQETIKANRDLRDDQIKDRLKQIEKHMEAVARQKADMGNRSIFQKISKYLGYAAAAAGIALAPFTAGISLVGTIYILTEQALEIAEEQSGIKMSLQSGIEIVCKKIVALCDNGRNNDEYKKNVSNWLSFAVNMLITVVVIGLTMGTGAAKSVRMLKNKRLMKSVFKDGFEKSMAKSLEKSGTSKSILKAGGKGDMKKYKKFKIKAAEDGTAAVRNEKIEIDARRYEKVVAGGKSETAANASSDGKGRGFNKINEFFHRMRPRPSPARKLIADRAGTGFVLLTQVTGSVSTIGGGVYGVRVAGDGLDVVQSDAERIALEKQQTRLDKFFAQCNDDLKILTREYQQDLAMVTDMVWGNIEHRAENLEALFHHNRLAI